LNYAAIAIAAASLATSVLRTARVQGADRQRIAALEGWAASLATGESVTAIGQRVDELELAVKEVNRTLNQVGIIATKVDGLDRLVTREMDEIKHTLRKLEERSFAPAPVRPARRA
jgi:hypothetical protein